MLHSCVRAASALRVEVGPKALTASLTKPDVDVFQNVRDTRADCCDKTGGQQLFSAQMHSVDLRQMR
jgi:hypothetical protein